MYSLPDGVDPAAAALVLHSAGTAYMGLDREARLKPGETVVVASASGADMVIDKHESFYEQVACFAPSGVDVWWDPNGGEDFERKTALLALRAPVIVMAGKQSAPTVPIGQLYTRDARILGFAISNASVEDLANAATTINHMLSGGKLKARVGASFHLSEAAHAHRAIEDGNAHGRILILS